MRIAFITSIPTPYQDPFLNVVAAHPSVELDVYYCAPKKADRPWELTWEFHYNVIHLPSVNLAKQFGAASSFYWNRGVIKRFREGNYDAFVVCGYNHLTMLATFAFARRANIPYFLSSEAYLKQRRKKWRVWVKDRLVRWIVTNAAGNMPTGTLASEYLVHYGADPDKLSRFPNAPDVESLKRQSVELRMRRDQLKADLGFGDEKIVLFVSRLVRFKRLDILLKAFALAFKEQPVKLVVLGDGVMREPWEQLSNELGLEDSVRFEGFVPPEDIPKWHAISDLFVQPSESETWSVAVLEALASRVPVVTTDMVGCYKDMINDERVGRVVPANDEVRMAEAMAAIMEDLPGADEVAKAWAPVYETVRYPYMAREFIGAIGAAVGENVEMDFSIEEVSAA